MGDPLKGLFNSQRYNRWRFTELSSGSNGVIYTDSRNPSVLVKVTKNSTNHNVNSSKLTNKEKENIEKSHERYKKRLVNGFKREFNTTKYVYEQLKALGITSFVPEVSNFRLSPRENKALFTMKKIPGITLNEFVTLSTTKPADIRKVKKKCLEHINNLERIGIIHGDLNPNNIMVNQHGKDIQVYFIDFGRSKKIANNLPGNLVYHPWHTTIGCKKGSRLCALPYVDPTAPNVLPYGNNRRFIESIFPTNGTNIVSYLRSYQNYQKLLRNQVNSINYINKTFKPILLARRNINQNIKTKIEQKKISMVPLDHQNIKEVLEYLNNLNSKKRTLPASTPTKTPKALGCGPLGCFGGSAR
jgi:serine/threonine protein kinase